LPKYKQLFHILVERIESGQWQENECIPPERELEELFNVSRTTVRQALRMMVSKGYLYREQGKGTFVTPQKMQQSIDILKSFSEGIVSRGCTPGQKILSLNLVKPSERIREKLELPENHQEVMFIKRVRYSNEQPIAIQRSYLNLGYRRDFSAEELEKRGSLYALLNEKYGLVPTEAVETLGATVASEEEAELLGISSGAPLLNVDRTVWSQNHTIMEYLRAVYRADRYQYTVRQRR
jgi:GntR family transcriptional regulator